MTDLPPQPHRPLIRHGLLALCLALFAGCQSLPHLPWSGDNPPPAATAAAETWRDGTDSNGALKLQQAVDRMRIARLDAAKGE